MEKLTKRERALTPLSHPTPTLAATLFSISRSTSISWPLRFSVLRFCFSLQSSLCDPNSWCLKTSFCWSQWCATGSSHWFERRHTSFCHPEETDVVNACLSVDWNVHTSTNKPWNTAFWILLGHPLVWRAQLILSSKVKKQKKNVFQFYSLMQRLVNFKIGT